MSLYPHRVSAQKRRRRAARALAERVREPPSPRKKFLHRFNRHVVLALATLPPVPRRAVWSTPPRSHPALAEGDTSYLPLWDQTWFGVGGLEKMAHWGAPTPTTDPRVKKLLTPVFTALVAAAPSGTALGH